MDLRLDGKVAVITGGSKGIGLATARALVREGCAVVVGSRKPIDDIDVQSVAVDLSTPDGPSELVDAAVSRHGGIDILVNNVGASEPAESAIAFTDAQWRRIFDITFFSTVWSVRAAAPVLAGRQGASIITISSLNSRLPSAMIAPYSAAKAALTNYSKGLADDLAPQGIRVNTISPGPVRTPMWTAPGAFAELFAEQAGTTVEDVMDRVLPESMQITTGRVSEADEVADLVAFLASERAANITGVDYVIDGGMLKSTP